MSSPKIYQGNNFLKNIFSSSNLLTSALFRDTPILSEKLPVQLDLTLNHVHSPYKFISFI